MDRAVLEYWKFLLETDNAYQLNSVVVFPKHRTVYIRFRRCGSRSVMAPIQLAYKEPVLTYNGTRDSFLKWLHNPETLTGMPYFVFGIVRHPYTRMLSYFRDNKWDDCDYTLLEFVTKLKWNLEPQSLICNRDQNMFTTLGVYSTDASFQTHASILYNRLHMSDTTKVPIIHTSPRFNEHHDDEEGEEEEDEDERFVESLRTSQEQMQLRRQINSHYRADFKTFKFERAVM